MRRKPLLSYILAATVLSSGLVITSTVLAREPVNANSAKITASSANTNATIETITQQIAKLEVERALQETRFIPESPVIRGIDSQLQGLHKRLRQLQPNGNKTAVKIAVSKALKAKIAELEIQRTKESTTFMSESPVIQMINAQLRSLHKRLAQVQSSASR